jgi:serine/threonine-protein kinase RsbW
MILRLSLDLPEDGEFVRITRVLGRTLLEHLQVVDSDVADLELLVGELCTNVLRHARSNDGRFRVALEYHADRVDLTVQDTGEGFTFRDVPDAGTTRADTLAGGERIGGFGMGLVRALADKLEFHRTDPHGTTVQARVDLHYETRAAAEKAAAMEDDEAALRVQTGGGGDAPPGG